MNLLLTFIALNVVNVVLQTVRMIATVKYGKIIAALMNALAYGLYTIVIIYMSADINIFIKALIVALSNLVGVYVVRTLDEKKQKDKLWKVEFTIKTNVFDNVYDLLKSAKIPFNFLPTAENYIIINVFCSTQKESHVIKEIIKQFNAKYFVSEGKIL